MDNGLEEAQRHGHARSPQWEKVRKDYASMFPVCAICGHRDKIQVHHVWPFHICIALGRPDLELDSRNLITLCEGPEEHHLLIGHLDSFKSANTNVRPDIPTFKGMTKDQIKLNHIWQLKVQQRLKPLDELSEEEKQNIIKRLNELYPRQGSSPLRER